MAAEQYGGECVKGKPRRFQVQGAGLGGAPGSYRVVSSCGSRQPGLWPSPTLFCDLGM